MLISKLQVVVKELLWEYARETVVDPLVLQRFKERLEFMNTKPPGEFSFWAATHIKRFLSGTPEGRVATLSLLTSTNARERLELQSKLLSNRITDV